MTRKGRSNTRVAGFLFVAFFLATFSTTPRHFVLWCGAQLQTVDSRLAPIKERLGDTALVGYVSDVPCEFDKDCSKVGYLLCQYALAPTMIRSSLDHDLVVGDFKEGRIPPELVKGLTVVLDAGNGAVLFKR